MAAALGVGPEPALLGLWADAAQVHALLLDRATGTPHLASVPVEGGAFPALSPARPAAAWFERMIHDLWGHHATGGTDARPWLDHGHWPATPPMAARPAPREGAPPHAVFLPATAPGLHILPLGPVRGGITAAAHLRLSCAGGRIVRAEARLGYTHRGIPLLMRGKSPRAAARFVARLAGEATVAHATAFARAAEAALDTEAPPRAAALRDAMLLMERTANHLGTLAAIAAAAGAASAAAECERAREMLARAAEAAFGHRMMMDAVVPGGLVADIAPDGVPAVRAAATAVLDALQAIGRRFAATDLAGIGCVEAGTAADFGAPDALAGDVAARAAARLRSAGEAAAALVPALADVPDGPLSVALPVGSGEGLAAAGSDPVWHWLRLDGGLIAACFPLDPGWLTWPVLEAALAGAAAEDASPIAASIGASVAGVDL
ncbi:MAG TPA: nickel-dependent hydrogenase large subunit [Acetobacteraceae bacterium]|nr:nickel-dependent hydrogenase large subunit [Acetobacteraceae bacterium]